MPNNSELNSNNYKRIFIINSLLIFPLLLIFSWPYIFISQTLAIQGLVLYTGAFLFSYPFTLTILHGHVTLALGSSHRRHYYDWLQRKPLTYGLLFHPMLTSTRFRLVLLSLSMIVLLFGWAF